MPKKANLKDKGNHKFDGVGGWLLFFVIIVTLSIIINIPSFVTNLIDKGLNFVEVLKLISLILSFTFLYLIGSKKKSAVKGIILLVWLDFVIRILWVIFDYNTLYQMLESQESVLGYIIFLLLLSLIIAIIVTSYFLKSIRVKNTFRK